MVNKFLFENENTTGQAHRVGLISSWQWSIALTSFALQGTILYKTLFSETANPDQTGFSNKGSLLVYHLEGSGEVWLQAPLIPGLTPCHQHRAPPPSALLCPLLVLFSRKPSPHGGSQQLQDPSSQLAAKGETWKGDPYPKWDLGEKLFSTREDGKGVHLVTGNGEET